MNRGRVEIRSDVFPGGASPLIPPPAASCVIDR
jgi:hypothetical protein